jgi:hypothetical protein
MESCRLAAVRPIGKARSRGPKKAYQPVDRDGCRCRLPDPTDGGSRQGERGVVRGVGDPYVERRRGKAARC